MKMHLYPLAFPLALALAVSASMPTGSGKGPEIDAGSGNTRTDHQRIALAALDPIVDAARPCVFRGTSTGTETSAFARNGDCRCPMHNIVPLLSRRRGGYPVALEIWYDPGVIRP
ncbi:hypothetical protein EDB87DRAFT_1573172 [Lactarius vividus]|nr:hypothetical protein EDB87DRAFT_1573172 [Lactarius vividus]